jgi:hypothetical protein
VDQRIITGTCSLNHYAALHGDVFIVGPSGDLYRVTGRRSIYTGLDCRLICRDVYYRSESNGRV